VKLLKKKKTSTNDKNIEKAANKNNVEGKNNK